MIKVGLISLGCAKNLVDSELILGVLKDANIEIVTDPQEADAIIINTCGFIESARQETVETILEMNDYGKKLIVAGCYAERYREKLEKEMPFVDKIITLKDYPKIHVILQEVLGTKELKLKPMNYDTRILTTSHVTPYVKISEGCNNRCAFCAIPLIRGNFRSRKMEDIVNECRQLVKNGAKEINLISQDTSRYGSDLHPEKKSMLVKLLDEISKIEGLHMIRVLYLYPDEITDEFIDYIKHHPIVAPYFDIPIQHISTNVLKKMLRRKDEAFHKELLYKIRREIPHAIFRTTLITGFPFETEEDHQLLLEFISEFEFDRLGVFKYSKEEDTKAYTYDHEVDEETKEKRYEDIMRLQKKIARKKNKEQIGRVHQTIIEAYDPQSKFYYGRSYAFAPDDVDGYIVFQSKNKLNVGEIVEVLIKNSLGYDLIGDKVEKGSE